MTRPTSPRQRIGPRWKYVAWLVALSVATFFLLGIGLANFRNTLTPLPDEADRTYASLLQWSTENGMPGAILLVQTPREKFLASAGKADVCRGVPMRTNHAIQIGSVTKSFVGFVAAQLHTERVLNLDAPITDGLPKEITARIAHAEKMTLRQLLEHTSGVYNFTDNPWNSVASAFTWRHGKWTADDRLAYALDQPGRFRPGEGWAYSNTGYVLAGLIIDRAAGHHHSVEIRRRILEPLQLTNTWSLIEELPRGELAHGYEDWFHWWWTDATDWTPATGGQAGIASTVSDLANYIRAAARDASFPSEAGRREALGDWTQGSKRYFFGLQRVRSREDAPWFLGHSGATLGYHCFAFHEPQRDITIVYFGSSSLMTARGDQFLDQFYTTLRNALFDCAVKQTESRR